MIGGETPRSFCESAELRTGSREKATACHLPPSESRNQRSHGQFRASTIALSDRAPGWINLVGFSRGLRKSVMDAIWRPPSLVRVHQGGFAAQRSAGSEEMSCSLFPTIWVRSSGNGPAEHERRSSSSVKDAAMARRSCPTARRTQPSSPFSGRTAPCAAVGNAHLDAVLPKGLPAVFEERRPQDGTASYRHIASLEASNAGALWEGSKVRGAPHRASPRSDGGFRLLPATSGRQRPPSTEYQGRHSPIAGPDL